MTPALFAACDTAVHVVTAEGEILRAGRAVIFILEQLGYPAGFLKRRPWIALVEWTYGLVAGRRKFFSRFLFRNE